MSKRGEIEMPKEMAGAANLMVHPLAGAAAMSALGVGLASQTFGAWMGALAGAAEVSQRLFQPIDAVPGDDAFTEHARQSPMRDEAAERQALIDKTKALAVRKTTASVTRLPKAAVSTEGQAQAARVATVSKVADVPAVAAEGVRQPEALVRPAVSDDLKAISGIGPKLEQVLNGLGIWTYGQISAWTADEIAWVENHLGFAGRVGRDGWQEQAAKLAAPNGELTSRIVEGGAGQGIAEHPQGFETNG